MYPQRIRYMTGPSAGPIVRYSVLMKQNMASNALFVRPWVTILATSTNIFFCCSEHSDTLTAETWRFQHHVEKLLPFLPGIVEATHLEYLRPKVSHFVSVSVSMCRSHVPWKKASPLAWPPAHMRFSRNGYGQANRALTTSFEVARSP
jgi:hypothetical protein